MIWEHQANLRRAKIVILSELKILRVIIIFSSSKNIPDRNKLNSIFFVNNDRDCSILSLKIECSIYSSPKSVINIRSLKDVVWCLKVALALTIVPELFNKS